MKAHYRKYFIVWLDGRLSPNKRKEVEQHLEQCAECREYFKRMETLFADSGLQEIPELEPQPYELTRIKQLAQQKKKEGSFRFLKQPLPAVVLYSVILFFTLMAGIWMGKGIYQSSHTNDLYAFAVQEKQYLNFSGTGFSQVWESMNNGETNEN
jgi:anti-sigma factor RsiW